ncbi:MAG: hypothetical protein KAU36_00130 [candidate division Zixibacteria bacterium]|nr:hypothetical protein [candidate division Zixibacteria bacterium]
MADYENKVHNIYFTANFNPTQMVRLFGTVTFNKAQGALQEVLMPDPEARLEGDLEDQDFDFENAPSYSDLDYKLLKFSLGVEYKLTPTVTLTADGDYADLTDNEGYIYGIESGSYFMIRTGVKLDL